ncbi:MAG: glycosyltransferase family 9 protein [Thermodesulfobacteriota bacterium]
MFNRLIQALLVYLFRACSRKRGPRSRPPEFRRVLLVSTTGLGDTIVSLAAMRLARQAWPQSKLYALLHRRWAGLAAACPFLDGVLVYPGKFRRVAGLINGLRRFRPDLTIILHANDPDVVPLAWLSGAGWLAAHDRSRFAFLLDQVVSNADPDRHIAERRMDLIRALAGPMDSLAPRLQIPETVRQAAAEEWRRLGLSDQETLIALNPGGSRQPKRWPDEYWRQLIVRLNRTGGPRLALFGAPQEKAYLRRLSEAPDRSPIIVAESDLIRTAGLVSRAAALIGPDSGLVHLAAALGVAVVVFFGPDKPALSRPYLPSAPAVILQSSASVCPNVAACHKKTCRPNVCLLHITPEMVLTALERELKFSLDFGY